ISAALITSVLIAGSPAFAVLVPGSVTPTGNGDPDLVLTSAGPARSGLLGALAPSQFDPLTGYPAAPPAGSVPTPVDFAGLLIAAPVPPGPQLLLYCIDLVTPTGLDVGYELGSWNESNVPNLGHVARLLSGYYPNTDLPESLTDARDKAAAVQAAIWFFSDK